MADRGPPGNRTSRLPRIVSLYRVAGQVRISLRQFHLEPLAFGELSIYTPSHKIVMETKEPHSKEKPPSGELLRDTLDMLILKTLQRGPMHGYGIAEFIEQRSDEVLRVEEGALYPALHRLELRGLLASEWGSSENNRRAKYYRLTASGRRQLQKDSARWGAMSAAIGRIMEIA